MCRIYKLRKKKSTIKYVRRNYGGNYINKEFNNTLLGARRVKIMDIYIREVEEGRGEIFGGKNGI